MFETFVINLDRHAGRMRFMAAQLEALGVPFTRFPAVNGYDPAAIAQAEAASFAPLSGGEIGCWESHRAVWLQILDRSLPGAFVLEDDMVLASDFGTLDFPSGLLGSCDVVKLDSFREPAFIGTVSLPVSGTRCVQRFFGNERSTGAYFITRRGAERLLAKSRGYFITIDEVMFRRQSRAFWDLEIWKLLPAIAVQARFELDPEALPGDLGDAIQTRMYKDGSDPKPVLNKFRRCRLRLRRLLDWDFGLVRHRREQRRLAEVRKHEEIIMARPDFVTPHRAHIELGLAAAR